MILLSHPTGNTFVRALLSGLQDAGALHSFHTTLSFGHTDALVKLAPADVRQELLRRYFDVPRRKIHTYPIREFIRLVSPRLGFNNVTRKELGWACVDAVYRDLDNRVGQYITQRQAAKDTTLSAVYCYEDGALQTFSAARDLGIYRAYELPIAYWETSRRLLEEEAARLPQWEPTLGGTRDSQEKLSRKTDEAALAELIVCPSKFVRDSLPEEIKQAKPCIIAEYGSPVVDPHFAQRSKEERSDSGRKLRVLFAGAMTQRKGLADVFAAMKLLKRSDVELIVLGSLVLPMEFYRAQYPDFKHEQTRPHHEVLKLMQSCDVFVLPSIVEGRALVQQEAMMCGLPIVITANTGGEDLVEDGVTGFTVPIRSPEKIAEKIAWFADHRSELEDMRWPSRCKADAVNWLTFSQKVIRQVVSKSGDFSYTSA